MIYMTLFWIIALICVALYFLQKYIFPKFPLENIFSILFFLGASFLIVGVLTKDPLFAQFGVPPEYEWVVGMFMTALASWRMYFNPLKQRVGRLESKVEALDAKLDAKIDGLEKRMENIQTDIHLIKEKLLVPA